MIELMNFCILSSPECVWWVRQFARAELYQTKHWKNQCYFKASWSWTFTDLYSSNSGLEAMQGIVFFGNFMCTNVKFSTTVNLVEIYSCFTIPLNHEIWERFNSATWLLSSSKCSKTVIMGHCQHMKDRNRLLDDFEDLLRKNLYATHC